MAKVTVRLYSLWQMYAGTETARLEADSLAEALNEIEDMFGAKLREGMKAKGIVLDGKIEEFSLVLLNGTNIKQVPDTALKDGDTIHIMPPLAGG
jgi:molybdopterin converting factor small subunit